MFLPSQGQFRGRTEIVPDQREKYLQRFQQVQQNSKQFSAQHQNPLLPQVLFLDLLIYIFPLTLKSMFDILFLLIGFPFMKYKLKLKESHCELIFVGQIQQRGNGQATK